jgi:segregation and condensation protein B
MSLGDRGIRIVREGEHVALATAPAAHEMIEKMRREELEGPLGKAGLETIAIIMFKGPVARSDIEYIRGVNCSSILRSLMIRGLIERVDNPKDKRSFLYQATTDLPAYFGIGKMEELPQYAAIKAQLEGIITEREQMMRDAEEKERASAEETV